MAHPPWLIPPPSGGSFGCFTSPWRGSAETAFRLDSESQEDREGPQLTSSDWSVGETMFPLRAPTWAQRRNWSSCQEGTGASSSSARSPFGSRYPKSALSSSQETSSKPSLTRWSSHAPRKTSFLSQYTSDSPPTSDTRSQWRTR